MADNKLPTIITLENKNIEECIFTIRDQQVMLDNDVAFFFGVETKRLNEQMKRNTDRFPEDFCFKLNSKELKDLGSQNATAKKLSSKRRYNPYVYTEHGIIALAGVIKSDIASKMSVEIVKKFVQMRRFILENGDVLLALAKLQNKQLEFENETNKKFDEMIKLINQSDLPKQALFYAGQFFDAYEYISAIIRRANDSVVLFDPYCDSKSLVFLKNKQPFAQLTICVSDKAKLKEEEVEKFELQYGCVTIKHLNDNHDRYLIIDSKECYQLGTSLNYAGKKMFSIIKVESQKMIYDLLKEAKN